MPRTKTRVRQRRARAAAEHARITTEIETLLEQIRRAATSEDRIAANNELVQLMKGIAASDRLRLWSFFPEAFFGSAGDRSKVSRPEPMPPAPGTPEAGAKVARDDADEVKALIAQLVAPHLMGRLPRWVRRRE